MATFFLADAHPFGVIAISAKGRGARCANPLAAALMTFFLFFEAFLQLLHNFFPAAERLNFFLFFFGQIFFGEASQPILWNFGNVAFAERLDALKNMPKNLVKFIEITLIFNQACPRQVVKFLNAAINHVGIECFHKRQIFPQRNRNIGLFKGVEKINKHRF